jgi:outer membrane lipoprotein-sorting protein
MKDVKEKMEQSKKTMSRAQKKGPKEKMECSLALFNEMDDFSTVNTQIHREITINGKIADSMFNFTPPEGARLVESFRKEGKSPRTDQ